MLHAADFLANMESQDDVVNPAAIRKLKSFIDMVTVGESENASDDIRKLNPN